jgi:hypothetical protein
MANLDIVLNDNYEAKHFADVAEAKFTRNIKALHRLAKLEFAMALNEVIWDQPDFKKITKKLDKFFQKDANKKAIYDYAIFCSEFNNTPETLAEKELHITIGYNLELDRVYRMLPGEINNNAEQLFMDK